MKVYLIFITFGNLLHLFECVKKDIVFVVDRSGSLTSDDINGTIDFIYNVTSYLDIGSDNVKISIVSFNDEVHTEIKFNDYSTKEELLIAIANLKGMSTNGGTYTYDALNHVRNKTLTSDGARDDAEKLVVVMTDGASIDLVATITMADKLRNDLSAELFSIAVGSKPDQIEIEGIANDPDDYYVHSVSDFVYLCNMIPSLVPKLDEGAVANVASDCPVEPGVTTEAATVIEETDSSSSNWVWILAAILGAILTILLLICCILFLKKKKRKPKEKTEAYKNIEFSASRPEVQGKPISFRESSILSNNGWTLGVNKELVESSIYNLNRESTASLSSVMYKDMFQFKPESKQNLWVD
ncbi:collagen alpha-1(XII) chain-like [Mytilus galloprovincialis]|uniref:collagen alpha-1(XII) chain-like n=1 Tax=Mytilus galloprovincialis TaxID=29158 RepID=UPI003F7C0384